MTAGKKKQVAAHWLACRQTCENGIKKKRTEEYLLWIKIHAHICQIILFRSGRSGSGESSLISWRTSAWPVYAHAVRERGVNLIIRQHKRANFLFNHFGNEQREPGASWKSTVCVLSRGRYVLIISILQVDEGIWGQSVMIASLMKGVCLFVCLSVRSLICSPSFHSAMTLSPQINPLLSSLRSCFPGSLPSKELSGFWKRSS